MSSRACTAAAVLLTLLLIALPFPAKIAAGQGFEVDLDRSTYFALSGMPATVGYSLFNLDPGMEDFTVECSGEGLTVSPASRTVTITGGGKVEGNVSVTAAAPGEYPLTVTMRQGDISARAWAGAIFLPFLSCKFVSPAANERTGAVGVGQSYSGKVNFTNWGPVPLDPTFALPARDIAGSGNARSSQEVVIDVGEIAPRSSVIFNYNGSSLPGIGTRDIGPTVKMGETDALYGYEVGAAGAFNVTRFGFTLSARELLGVEMSNDRFALGERAQVTLYVESRKAGGIAGGSVDVSLHTDIEARNELADYAPLPRFEEFASLVRSGVAYDKGFTLEPMEPGVQKLQAFSFEPKVCRASSSGGSFFLDFRGDLGGTASSVSVPVSVISPLTISMDAHEKVVYAPTDSAVLRTMTVRNVSNSTISGASASFFLDFKERGFVKKADIADTPVVPLPPLAPGEETVVTLTVVPRSPGTYAFFPVVSFGAGLMVYGSHIQVAASAPQVWPAGPYVTAFVAIAVTVAIMRRFSPG